MTAFAFVTTMDTNLGKDGTSFGWAIFLLNSVVLFGIHFMHDLPSPLQGVLQASPQSTNGSEVEPFGNGSDLTGLGFTPFQYNQLYAIYSIGEGVTAIVAGIAIDRFGRTANLIAAGLLSGLGGLAFALGPLLNSRLTILVTMLVGRFLMAVSNAFLFVLQGVVILFWFEDRVTTAFGAVSCANAAGEVLNFLITKPLYNALGLQWVLWISMILVIVGTSLPATALGYLDSVGASDQYKESRQTRQNKLSFSDLVELPLQYWLLVFTRVFFNSMIWALIGDISKFVTDRYGYSEASVVPSYFAGIFFGLSTVGCFCAGRLMDSIGYRLVITSISILGSMATLSLLAFTLFPPHICAVFISIFYSFAAVSVIACITLVVPTSTVGTAIGITLTIEMCFTAASNVVIGLILGQTHEYHLSDAVMQFRWQLVIVYTIGLTGVAFIFSLAANIHNMQTGGALNKTQSEVTAERHNENGFQKLRQDEDD
ncbi:uncharacterized protein LOC119732586 isoform X1 [Patiria miniata]|uniref:Lysosomal dipeptide transporter MFSD1 n=1 Tax=Patiria miniata TaxID=46514 RepID=A0A914AFD4_PATMI|nr:uncharacterized protein LOC119732586 isoform X1 [Patiria miniata]